MCHWEAHDLEELLEQKKRQRWCKSKGRCRTFFFFWSFYNLCLTLSLLAICKCDYNLVFMLWRISELNFCSFAAFSLPVLNPSSQLAGVGSDIWSLTRKQQTATAQAKLPLLRHMRKQKDLFFSLLSAKQRSR